MKFWYTAFPHQTITKCEHHNTRAMCKPLAVFFSCHAIPLGGTVGLELLPVKPSMR